MTATAQRWNNVKFHGMGFITGFKQHPLEPSLKFARTDVGGIYRFDTKKME